MPSTWENSRTQKFRKCVGTSLMRDRQNSSPDGGCRFPSVSDVMTHKVFAVSPDTSLETAARLFAQKRVSGVPVVDASGEVVGVVSASDLNDPDRDRGEQVGSAQ